VQSQTFQLDLNDKLNIVNFSNAFGKVCPELTVNAPFSELFKLVAPQLPLSTQIIKMFNGQLITLCPISSPSFVFGGAFYEVDDNYCFIGYPQLTNMGQLSKMNLALNDFVHHDPINFYIGTLQLKESMYQEMIQLNDELKASAKHLEKLVEQRTQELLHAEKMASLGVLAAGVAHEINNPIGFLLSNLNTLKSYMDDIAPLLTKLNNLPDKEKEQLDTLTNISVNWDNIDFICEDIGPLIDQSIDGSKRVSKTVAGLKNFAHPSDSKQEVMSVQQAIDLTLSLLNNELRHNVTLHYERENDVYITGNLTELSQVFINLVMNATQAVEKDGVISIKTEELENSVKIYIADNGCGISSDNLPKLFQPFFTTKEVGSGTGLGLAISHGIIENHNGSISVESKEGVGTTFTIELPLADSQAIAES